jgi:glycosyltransferase involved in cell wall biosynthesis
MSRIAVVTPHVTTGDAVSNDVFGMHDVLTRRGFQTRIYAADWTNMGPQIEVWPISEIGAFLKSPTDVLIYHHSMGWATGSDLLRESNCRKFIKYHNVTPPEFFSGWSEEYELVCNAGRAQSAEIAAGNFELYLSDSEYNKSEMISYGAPPSRSFAVPPFNRIDRLMNIEPDFEIIDQHLNGAATLLMVGSVFPNKGHASLLEAFAMYVHYYNKDSHLIVVGKKSKSLGNYIDSLKELIVAYGLEGKVDFPGTVTDGTLKSYYLVSDLFVTASEHEGFCVPLIESMAMTLPIVSYASSAISETVGEVGLVWDERDPNLLAESIDTLMKDQAARAAIGHLGRRRYEEVFTNGKLEERFWSVMGEVL